MVASAGPVMSRLYSLIACTSVGGPSIACSDAGAWSGNGRVTTSRIVLVPVPRVSSNGVPEAIIRPRSMMWTWSASRSASSR